MSKSSSSITKTRPMHPGREPAPLHPARRTVLAGLGSLAASASATALLARIAPRTAAAEKAGAKAANAAAPPFAFKELEAGIDGTHHVADGYYARPLLSWGDPIFADAPAFDPANQTAEAQLRQFGTNNDFNGLVPLNDEGSRALLCVNHEYALPHMMFHGVGRHKGRIVDSGPDRSRTEMAAIGGSIVEIERQSDGTWNPILTSRYNRRISPLETSIVIDGPAAGHPRLQTNADPTGLACMGTLANCAGGITPWGTWLMPEENFHFYFIPEDESRSGIAAPDVNEREQASRKRYGIPAKYNIAGWGHYEARFDLAREPNEPNRFGWLVEVDPLEPGSTPVKHTAFGRFRREGAESTLAKSGQVVVYSGDDDRNEFIYKFVSDGAYKPDERTHNKTLLSSGTLYAARFDENGGGVWLKLTPGEGRLAGDPRFSTLADILIDARIAASVAGATPMDRPEDVEPDGNGRVIVALTNNTRRKKTDAANPRRKNKWGQIIEMMEAGGDHAASRFTWSHVVICGDKDDEDVGASWHPDTTDNGWFCCPDNVAFDPLGRLWVATDQGTKWDKISGKADGLYAVDLDGDHRGRSKLFFRAPVGAEVGGPRFTPDGMTLFVSVQHPSADDTKAWKPFGRHSTASDPATRWPGEDPNSNMPPRASVVMITRRGGGKIAV